MSISDPYPKRRLTDDVCYFFDRLVDVCFDHMTYPGNVLCESARPLSELRPHVTVIDTLSDKLPEELWLPHLKALMQSACEITVIEGVLRGGFGESKFKLLGIGQFPPGCFACGPKSALRSAIDALRAEGLVTASGKVQVHPQLSRAGKLTERQTQAFETAAMHLNKLLELYNRCVGPDAPATITTTTTARGMK